MFSGVVRQVLAEAAAARSAARRRAARAARRGGVDRAARGARPGGSDVPGAGRHLGDRLAGPRPARRALRPEGEDGREQPHERECCSAGSRTRPSRSGSRPSRAPTRSPPVARRPRWRQRSCASGRAGRRSSSRDASHPCGSGSAGTRAVDGTPPPPLVTLRHMAHFDPADPRWVIDPMPHFDELREEAPVHLRPTATGSCRATRTASPCCATGERRRIRCNIDPERAPRGLSRRGAAGRTFAVDPRRGTRTPGPSCSGTPRPLAPARSGPAGVHAEERRRARAFIEAEATRLLDAALAQGSCDMVGALAWPLPVAVISELLGCRGRTSEEFKDVGQCSPAGLDPEFLLPEERRGRTERGDRAVRGSTSAASSRSDGATRETTCSPRWSPRTTARTA